MAKKIPKPRHKKHRKNRLKQSTLDADAIFTMILSCETFLSKSLKNAGIKVNSSVLLERMSTALMDTLYAQPIEDKPMYNVAADSIAAAYIAHIKGNDKQARVLAKLAFESPDCEPLIAGLIKINEIAVGVKLVADDMDDQTMDDSGSTDSNVATDTADSDDNTPDDDDDEDDSNTEETADTQAGGEDDFDENNGGVNPDSADEVTASLKIRKRVRRLIKAAKDEYKIDYGIDGPEGNFTNLPDLNGDDEGDDDLLEVETLGQFNDKIPDTMRLGRPTDINELVGDYPDNLPKIDMLTAKEIGRIARKNPDLITVANKIAILGDQRGVQIAHKFLRKAS